MQVDKQKFDLPGFLKRSDYPLCVQKQLCQEATGWLGDYFPSLAPMSASETVRFGRELTGKVREVQVETEHGRWVRAQGAKLAADTLLDAGMVASLAAAPETLGTSLLVGAMFGAMKWTVDFAIDLSLQLPEEQVTDVSSECLRKRYPDLSQLPELGDLDPGTWYNKYFDDAFLFGPNSPLHNVPDELKPYWAQEVKRQIVRQVGNLSALHERKIDDLGTKIERMNQKLDATFSLAKRNREKIAYLNAKMKEIGQELGQIKEHLKVVDGKIASDETNISRNAYDVNWLKHFLYNKMSPKEQQAALKAGYFDGMPETDSSTRKNKERAITISKELPKIFGELASGSAILGQVGSILDFPEDVQKTMGYAATAFTAAAQFFGGDTFGAISTALGAFTKSAAQQRHEQIMERLGALLEGQKYLMGQVNEVLRGEQQLAKGQQAIYKEIANLGHWLEERERDVMDMLVVIDADVIQNRVAITSGNRRGLDQGHVFLNTREEEDLDTFDLFRAHFGSFQANFHACWMEMEAVFESGRLHENLLLADARNPERAAKSQKFTEKVFRPAAQLFRGFYPDDERRAPALTALLIPTARVAALKGRVQVVPKEAAEALPDRLRFREEWLEGPLDAQMVVEYGQVMTGLQRYWPLVRSDGQSLYTFKEALANPAGSGNIKAERLLKHYTRMLDLAIAQQGVLSGQVVIEPLFEHLAEELSSPEPKPAKWALAALKDNRLLQHNLALYLVHREVPNPYTYDLALRSKAELGLLFSPKWCVHIDPDQGWVFSIPSDGDDSINIPLPEGRLVRGGTLLQTPDMGDLLGMRRAVAEAQLDNAYPTWSKERLTLQEQEALRDILIGTATK